VKYLIAAAVKQLEQFSKFVIPACPEFFVFKRIPGSRKLSGLRE